MVENRRHGQLAGAADGAGMKAGRMANWSKRLVKAALPFALHPRGLLAAEVAHKTKLRLIGGAFKGMSYLDSSLGSELVPKLLGLYERELTPIIEEIIAMKPAVVIDIGAAEGYFAVGLAVRIPGVRIVAFEMDERGRSMIAELARRNSVLGRIDIRGKCEPETLRNTIDEVGDCVIICDSEGYEDPLLNPAVVQALGRLPILVEVHEFIISGMGQELRRRFAPTHCITEIAAEHRAADEYPYDSLRRKLIPKRFVEYIVNDSRPAGMFWLWLLPKQRGGSAG